MSPIKKLWIGLGVLALLSPLGLVIPHHFRAGTAWGEWGGDKIKTMLGYVPAGLEELSKLWKAPLAQYGLGGRQNNLFYVLSAVIGGTGTALLVWLLGKALVRKNGQG